VKPRVTACLLLTYAFAFSPRASADGPELSAQLTCAPATGPGRILCEIAAHEASGKLVWVDALVVRAPDFARPLRARVVAQVGSGADAGTATAKLALVATELGHGTLEVLVRGVVCHEQPSGQHCGPEVARVSSAVDVGQSAPVPSPAP
jgi:hypothetical protein